MIRPHDPGYRAFWHKMVPLSLSTIAVLGAALFFSLGSPVMAQEDDDPVITVDPDVAAALDEIRAGRVNQGIKRLETLGATGNGEAFFHLGQIYALGAGRKPNPEKAADYLRSASRLGHLRADLSLANLLYFDLGTPDALEEAYKIYKTYALAGEPEAQYVLGMMFWNGDLGEEVDPIRGYALIWLATENGFVEAEAIEIEMMSQLNLNARLEAKRYARNLEEEGFSRTPLRLDLVLPEEDKPTLSNRPLSTRADFEQVWHVEVGVSSSREAAEDLRRVLRQTMDDDIATLSTLIVETNDQPVRYKILYGPFSSFQDTVFQCVQFKGKGQDCFSRAPKE